MMGTKSVKRNVVIALLHQLVTAVSGLMLSRVVLESYGSEVNGILQTVNQFLNYVTLLECGIGGVILASLYLPLAQNDTAALSDILLNTRTTYRKLSYVYLAFIAVLSAVLGFVIQSAFDAVFVGSIVLIMGVTVYFNYYITIAEQLLLKADQRLYVVQTVQILVTLTNLAVCVIAMKSGADVRVVKGLTLLIYLVNPIYLRYYARKHYHLNKTVYDKTRKYPRKRDGIVHFMAYFVHRNTDIAILSVVCGTKTVSVYSTYYSVVLLLENVLSAISTAVIGYLGKLTAINDTEKLRHSFELYQAVNTCISFVFSTVAAVMILPFVTLYTKGISDADYHQPLFAGILLAGQLMYCLRIPFIDVISARGLYRETRVGAVAEVLCNIVISLMLVWRLGLIGVALGTFVAMTVRTTYLVWFLSRNILHRPVGIFVRDFAVNAAFAAALIGICGVVGIPCDSFPEWILCAAVVTVAVTGILFAVNLLLQKSLRSFVRSAIWKK